MPGSAFSMNCEHGNDRATCIDCSAERTMRQAATSDKLKQLTAEFNEIVQQVPQGAQVDAFIQAAATVKVPLKDQVSVVATELVRISSKLHSCLLDCQRLLSSPDLTAYQRANVQAVIEELNLPQKTFERIRASL